MFPVLRSCVVHYCELILFHLGLCPYSCHYLFAFCLLFYSMIVLYHHYCLVFLNHLMEISFLSPALLVP